MMIPLCPADLMHIDCLKKENTREIRTAIFAGGLKICMRVTTKNAKVFTLWRCGKFLCDECLAARREDGKSVWTFSSELVALYFESNAARWFTSNVCFANKLWLWCKFIRNQPREAQEMIDQEISDFLNLWPQRSWKSSFAETPSMSCNNQKIILTNDAGYAPPLIFPELLWSNICILLSCICPANFPVSCFTPHHFRSSLACIICSSKTHEWFGHSVWVADALANVKNILKKKKNKEIPTQLLSESNTNQD